MFPRSGLVLMLTVYSHAYDLHALYGNTALNAQKGRWSDVVHDITPLLMISSLRSSKSSLKDAVFPVIEIRRDIIRFSEPDTLLEAHILWLWPWRIGVFLVELRNCLLRMLHQFRSRFPGPFMTWIAFLFDLILQVTVP